MKSAVSTIYSKDVPGLRVGDYRIIYRFDAGRGEIYLVAIGHRREVYRA